MAAHKGSTALLEVRNIADEIRERGHRHTSRITLLEEEQASTGVAEALGLATNARVFHSIIVHSEDDVPIQIEDRFVNPAICPQYLEQDCHQHDPERLSDLVAPDHADESRSSEAFCRSRGNASSFRSPRRNPSLMIRRRTWSEAANVTSRGSPIRVRAIVLKVVSHKKDTFAETGRK